MKTARQLIGKCILVSLTTHFAPQTFAGGMEGGGGNSVVCRDSLGKMISAEVFDLFEGRALYGYIPKENADDFKSQARRIAKKMDDATATNFFEKETERILNEMRFLPADVALRPVDDSNSIIKPSNCELFQTAIYLSNKRVYFDSNIWALLTETHRAALVSHEVFYAYLRLADETKDSGRARQYVSYMFSGQNLKAKWSPTDFGPFEVCQSKRENTVNGTTTPAVQFYTGLNPDGTWKISFRYFNGLSVLGSAEIDSAAPHGYAWPIASHNIGGIPGGPGVGLSRQLDAPVDEGWSILFWFLDSDSDNNFITVRTGDHVNQIYFTCQKIGF